MWTDELIGLLLAVGAMVPAAILTRFFWQRRRENHVLDALGIFFSIVTATYAGIALAEIMRLGRPDAPLTWWRLQALGFRTLLAGALWHLVARLFNGGPRRR